MRILKLIIGYGILLLLYIFLPGIVQQIFMKFDDYYFYIIITILMIANILFAIYFLKKTNLESILFGIIITAIGALSVVIISNLNFSYDGITVALFSNAIISILAWQIFQFKKKSGG